jgi:hypothetical protein
MQFTLGHAATHAFVERHELALLYIELLFLNHFPFVVAVSAQGIPPVFLRELWFLESNDIAHRYSLAIQWPR